MNAVGKLHSTGVSSKIRIARPYPAPCTICSVPYVPPDTMKNVAATSGQSVSLAILFLVVVMELAGSWAGRDKELNSYLVLLSDPRSRCHGEANSHPKNTRLAPACNNKMHSNENFFVAAGSSSAPFSSLLAPALRPAPRFLLRAVYLRGCDKLRRLLHAFIIQSEGSFRMRLVSRLAIFLAVLVLTPFALAQQPAPSPRPITVDDYFRIREVHEPQLSPDAQSVAYTVKTAILKTDKNEERIWMVPRSGGDAIALTAEGVSSSHPRWSPDGKSIAFLSERNDRQTQVWLLGLRGGEAQRLT